MALPVFFDRVLESFTTTGTGTVSLLGAQTGYQAFSAGIGSGTGLVYYTMVDSLTAPTAWEVGQGTYTFSGTTLSRTTILSSSNSNSAVNWASGTKFAWLDVPASAIKPSGFLGVSQTTVDFGSTNIPSQVFTVTDANIISTHNIIATQSAKATSNRTADENGVDILDLSATAGSGQFSLYANAQAGVVTGQFTIYYIYS